MSKPDLDIDNALLEFATLSGADRRAISRLLSAGDRRVLDNLKKGQVGPVTRSGSVELAPRDSLEPFSPGLQRHLKRVLEPAKSGGPAAVTPTVRALLKQMLTSQPPAARGR